METKTLFDLTGNEIIESEKKDINRLEEHHLIVLVVGGANRPASSDDMIAVQKELAQAKAEGRPCFFSIPVNIQLVLRSCLPKAIFQLGNDERPANDEDIKSLREAVECGIKEKVTVIAPYPLTVSYLN